MSGAQPEAPVASRPTAVAIMVMMAIIVATLYLTRELLVPMVLAVLLAFILAPLVGRLQRLWVPRGPAVLLVVALAFVLISIMGFVVGRQAASLATGLPAYRVTIEQKLHALEAGGELLDRLDSGLSSMLGNGPGKQAPTPEPGAAAGVTAPSLLAIGRTVLPSVLGPISTGAVVAVFAIFVLLAREDLRDRLVRLLGQRDMHRTILALTDAATRLSRYFLFQLLLNAGFGLFVGTGLWLLGLPGFALWGILAAIMRFVPFIGTVIAVAPPVLLSIVVAPGWSLTFEVLALFILTDVIVSQAVEPLLYGHSTGLSPIAIIVSAAFWAFVWGPIGLVLATPLTVCLVVLGRHVAHLGFLEVMLGDQPPLEPPETFYQRALEGNGRELLREARRQVALSSLTAYYDNVALRGLALAQADLARDALGDERLEEIHGRIETLLTASAAIQPAGHQGQYRVPATELPPSWAAAGAVLCIPGRGQLDDLAATMATQTLRGAGFGAEMVSNARLGSSRSQNTPADGQAAVPPVEGPALCCLSVLDDGSTIAGVLYLMQRMRRQMPRSALVICLWHATTESKLLQELRSADGEIYIVMSLGELIALARVLSSRGNHHLALATSDETPGSLPVS